MCAVLVEVYFVGCYMQDYLPWINH